MATYSGLLHSHILYLYICTSMYILFIHYTILLSFSYIIVFVIQLCSIKYFRGHCRKKRSYKFIKLANQMINELSSGHAASNII